MMMCIFEFICNYFVKVSTYTTDEFVEYLVIPHLAYFLSYPHIKNAVTV